MRHLAADAGVDGPVAAYKRVLHEVLDQRPSGMRQRLAEALGKNRSFISQIANPIYPTPIPVQYLDQIFEICHFSPAQRDEFLAAYRLAHPRRFDPVREEAPVRRAVILVPDLGNEAKNRKLDELLGDVAQKFADALRED